MLLEYIVAGLDQDICSTDDFLRKRKTSYRLTNPIESARMKESLAESMGFS